MLALMSGTETACAEFSSFGQLRKICSIVGSKTGEQKSGPADKKKVWG